VIVLHAMVSNSIRGFSREVQELNLLDIYIYIYIYISVLNCLLYM